MRLPETPPSIPDDPQSLGEIFASLRNPKVAAIVGHANSRYLRWDEFRRRPLVAGFSAEHLWRAVRLARLPHLRPFGLRSDSGKPFVFSTPATALRDLHQIDLQLGGTISFDDTATTSSVERDRFLIGSLMEEAISSSQIEGAATTREVAKRMLREGRSPRTRGERMIFNNYLTIQKLRDWKDRELTLDALLEIQASLTSDTLDDTQAVGRLRTDADRIRVVDTRNETVLHVPPPASQLPERIARFCEFANKFDDSEFVHPVVRAILLHFWLGYEHPFVDGNGRTARAISYWYLLKAGYWLVEFLPLSRVIVRAPARYGRAFLHSESDSCDATYFLMYILEAVRRALKELVEYLRRKQRQRAAAVGAAARISALNDRQARLVGQLLTDPGREITVEEHGSDHPISYGTAYNDLAGLVRRGLLLRRRVGRRLTYRASPKLLALDRRAVRHE
ncbi:MAG: Fic family protein [Phycisphaerae bacterium]